MQPYKICCLTYKMLDRLVKESISHLTDPELEVITVEGLREEIISELTLAQAQGAEVVVGGGANAEIAREYCRIPVMEYRINAFDYLEAVDKAFTLGHRLAITTYKTPMDDALSRFMRQREISFVNIVYESTADLENKLIDCACDVVVGASHTVEVASQLGLKSILIYPGQASILDALQEAKKVAREFRRSNEQAKYAQAVFTNSTNGLILLDSGGNVLDANEAARQIVGNDNPTLKGIHIEAYAPECGAQDFFDGTGTDDTQIRTVNAQPVLCKWVRLSGLSEGLIGSVGILSCMSDINRAQLEYEEKLRREQMKKGFSAKLHFSDILGSSPALTAAIEEARCFAGSEASVLLCGETGVGKELFAQSIHNESRRHREPFVAVNCAALPENLLESELFGYDEGAFTGGRKGGKKGLFELANHGTIFLDEIGELSAPLQSRLLRVLQEREIMHVGGDRVIPVDIRVIAATNKDLEYAEAQSFRRDLFYRLSVLELRIPALRERAADALLLFDSFYRQKCNRSAEPVVPSEAFAHLICTYSWPGNIRELQNACERFFLYVGGGKKPGEKFLRRCLVRAIGEQRLLKELVAALEPFEQKLDAQKISSLQEMLGCTKEQLASKLGISRTTIWRLSK